MVSAVFKSLTAITVLAIAGLAFSGDAKAWGWGGYYGYDYGYYYDAPYASDYYYYPAAPYVQDYVYVQPAPVVTYDYNYRYSARPEPWSPEWYEYCSCKYRSFDPSSGTYQPYHGPRRLCR